MSSRCWERPHRYGRRGARVIDRNFLTNIESPAKAVAWGSVGSRARLESAVLTDPDVRGVLKALGNLTAQRQLVKRIGALVTMGGSPEYLHRYDLAIFAYLRMLDIFEPEFAAVAARKVAALGNTWWSRGLAFRLRASSRTASRDVDSKATHLERIDDSESVRTGSTRSSPDVVSSPSIIYPDMAQGFELAESGSVAIRTGHRQKTDYIQYVPAPNHTSPYAIASTSNTVGVRR